MKNTDNMIVSTSSYHIKDFILNEEAACKNYFLTHQYLNLDQLLDRDFISSIIEDMQTVIPLDPDLATISANGHIVNDSILNLHKTDIYASISPNYMPPVMHTHSYIEIVYLFDGNCTNYSGNQKLELKKGDFLILAPNTKHAISAFNSDCRYINIMVRSAIFENTFFNSFSEYDILYKFFHTVLFNYKINSYLLFETQDDNFMQSIIIQLLEESEKNHFYQEKMKVSLMQMLFNHLINRYTNSALIFNDGINSLNTDVTLILNYMQLHYQDLKLTETANFFGYSERQLSRILLKYTGENYRENMCHIKMRKAKQFLGETEMSIDEIAGLLGYNTAFGFRKVFKQEYNMTPSKYRKLCKDKVSNAFVLLEKV